MTATIGETATVAHGYTMAQLDEYARRAVRIRRSAKNMDYADAYDAAWHEIVYRLYDPEQPEAPAPWDLIWAGINAVQDAQGENLQAHGLNRLSYEVGPRFGQYWLPVAGASDGFTDRVDERLALPQILSQLTDLEYEALATQAIYESGPASASALGVTLAVFNARLRRARAKVFELWFAPETPRPPTKKAALDEVCRNGHARAQHAVRRLNVSLGYETWLCHLCERNRNRRARARR